MRPPTRYLPAILVLAFTIPLAACQRDQPDRSASASPVVGTHDQRGRFRYR